MIVAGRLNEWSLGKINRSHIQQQEGSQRPCPLSMNPSDSQSVSRDLCTHTHTHRFLCMCVSLHYTQIRFHVVGFRPQDTNGNAGQQQGGEIQESSLSHKSPMKVHREST